MVSPDALVAGLGSGRDAIYTMLFDARRKLRAALVADGCPGPWHGGPLMSGRPVPYDFRRTGPARLGCAEGMEMPGMCDNLVAAGAGEAAILRHPARLRVQPVRKDFEGLLAAVRGEED
jgi:hypothetical protein